MEEERQSASFNSLKLSYFLYGEKKFKRMNEILDMVRNDPVFDRGDTYYISREQLYRRSVEKNVHMLKRVEELGLTDEEDKRLFRRYFFFSWV